MRDAGLGEQLESGPRRGHVARRAQQLQMTMVLVVFEADEFAQLLQLLAAVHRQALHAFAVGAVAFERAFAQPGARPAPERGVEARAQADRGGAAEQGAQHLAGHAGGGPGRDMARGDQAGVGETAFLGGIVAAVDQGDLVSGGVQVMRGGDADDAGADDNNMHGGKKDECGSAGRTLPHLG